MMHCSIFLNSLIISILLVLSSASCSFAEFEEVKPKSGVYNNIQLVPNFFATYCGYSADDLAGNLENRNHCLHKLGVYVNSSDAESRAKNRQDYTQNVIAEGIRSVMALTIAKNASIPDLRESASQLASTTTQSTTIHDYNKGHVLALSVYKDVLDSHRELIAESNLSSIARSINNLDRDIAIEVARDQSNIIDTSIKDTAHVNTSSGRSESNSNGIKGNNGSQVNKYSPNSFVKEYTPNNPYLGKWMWVKDNTCSRAVCTGKGNSEASLNCTYEKENCPDGAYSTNVSNKIVSCKEGKCEILGTRDEDICGDRSLVWISKLKFSYQSGDQPAVCTNGDKFTLCVDGKYRISGSFYHACRNGKCVECLGNK